MTDAERFARARLTWVAYPPADEKLGWLVRHCGPVEAVELIRAGILPCGIPAGPDLQRAMSRWHAASLAMPSREEVESALHGRFRLMCPNESEWPTGLDGLGDAAPIALWALGRAPLSLACRRSVAVVGARACTAYGAYVAAELGASLAGDGWTVVSGGAFGVDAAAHGGALGAGGVTIAVLAGGLAQPHPAGHAVLFDAIAAQGGALVSEAPPDVRVSRLRFLARNRIIAALAGGTTVVESGSRSGALTTARHAGALGRPVMAIPGPVTSETSQGCNDLIRRGDAVLVSRADDIVRTLAESRTAADG